MARILRILVISLGILLIGYVGLHLWLKNKVETQLRNKLPQSWTVSYKDLNLNLLTGTIEFKDLSLFLRDSLATTSYLDVEAEKLGFYEVGYRDLLKSATLNIQHARLLNPSIIYKPFAHHKDTISKGKTDKTNIAIGKLAIENGGFKYYPSTLDTLGVMIASFNLELDDIQSLETNNSGTLPFTHGAYILAMDSLKAPLGHYEELWASNVRISNDSVQLTDVHLNTLWEPKEFSHQLKVERDHYKLYIPKILLPMPQFDKKEDRTMISLPHLFVVEPQFQVYRDKLLPDEFSTKTLFSEKFRNLPFLLKLDSLEISKAAIKYIERDQYYNEGGYIQFSDMAILGHQLGNGYPEDSESKITGRGKFMKQAALSFDWKFKTYDTSDHFVFSAEVDNMPASDINKLTHSNLEVLFDGKINRCQFSVIGNKHHSRYDFNIKYHDLKVEILNRKKEKKRWLGTKIANLFIRNNSKSKEGDSRSHKGEVTRIAHKSFFNYLWRNVEDGLIHTVI